MDVLYDTLYKQSPWVISDFSDWQAVIDELQLKPYSLKKGTIVYNQGDPKKKIFVIKNGRVNLSILDREGNEKCLYVIGRGGVFGEVALFGDGASSAQAIAMTLVNLYEISGERLLEMLETSIPMNRIIIQSLVKKIYLLTSQMELLCFRNSVYRVIESILYMTEQFGKRDENGGVLIEMKFTHQEMANLVGVSRVTVTNIFLRIEREGRIEKRKEGIYIRNLQMLREYIAKT